MLCFHGYGEEGGSFSFLENALGNHYTLLAPDMPLHGFTQWNEGLTLTPGQLVNWVQRLIQHAGFSDGDKISLLGFSMGGRICLQLAELMPGRVERLALVAPDGFHKNFWYRLSTQTTIGNRLFNYCMKQPAPVFSLMKLAGSAGVMNKSVLKIAHYYLEDGDERNLLYRRWTTMRQIKPSIEKIAGCINRHHIVTRLLFGRYDRVILSKRAQGLQRICPAWVQIHIIDAGHQLLKEKHAATIASLFFE